MLQFDVAGTALLTAVWLAVSQAGVGGDGLSIILIGAAFAWVYARRQWAHRSLQGKIDKLEAEG